MARALIIVAALALSGCLFQEHSESRLAFVCRALGPGEPITLHGWGEVDQEAMEALALALTDITRRDTIEIVAEGIAPALDPDTIRPWADDHRFYAGRGVHMHVVWAPFAIAPAPATSAVDLHNLTGAQWAPGIFTVSTKAIEAASIRLGVPAPEIATGVLLHHAGHALGLVNDAVPVQTPAILDREDPPKHDPDPSAIMHIGWEDAGKMDWAPAKYSEQDLADWAGARTGVCA